MTRRTIMITSRSEEHLLRRLLPPLLVGSCILFRVPVMMSSMFPAPTSRRCFPFFVISQAAHLSSCFFAWSPHSARFRFVTSWISRMSRILSRRALQLEILVVLSRLSMIVSASIADHYGSSRVSSILIQLLKLMDWQRVAFADKYASNATRASSEDSSIFVVELQHARRRTAPSEIWRCANLCTAGVGS